MEILGLEKNIWDGRNVLLTGHTGFKGGWTALLLTMLGARVHGLSVAPTEASRFFKSVGIDRIVK